MKLILALILVLPLTVSCGLPNDIVGSSGPFPWGQGCELF